jgi:hypothetical protein
MQVRYFIFGCRFIVSCISTTACDCDPIGCNCVYDTKILKRYCCFYNELGLLLWHSLHFLFCFHCLLLWYLSKNETISVRILSGILFTDQPFWLLYYFSLLLNWNRNIMEFWRRYSVVFCGMVHAHFTYGFIGMTNTSNDRNRDNAIALANSYLL